MAFLFSLIAIGYILAKLDVIPKNTESVLSKLENFIFMPALVMGTFIKNFTLDNIKNYSTLLLGSVVVELAVIALSMIVVRLCTNDKYIQNIYLYGLSFANFGFMGIAVVNALFAEVAFEYILFTIVLWVGIYAWGAPVLLMGSVGEKVTIKARLKNFVNPMFIGMAIGMIIGITNIPVPSFIGTLVDSLGACMSPLAMLLTGMTVARSPIVEIISKKSIYAITAVRLILYPAIFLVIAYFVPMSRPFLICALCSLAMPLGLNTIVIPAAYGKDTKVASGMALISHLAACITIPIVFACLDLVL